MDPLTSCLSPTWCANARTAIAREADAVRFRAAIRARPSVLRRGLAHGFALVSRTSVGAVRRLDDCLAEDLGEPHDRWPWRLSR